MFAVGYTNKAMTINAIDVKHISFKNVEKLRRLVIQLLKNPCGKIILDLDGIKMIDRPAVEVINRLSILASKQNVIIEFANVANKVESLFAAADIPIKTTTISQAINLKSLKN